MMRFADFIVALPFLLFMGCLPLFISIIERSIIDTLKFYKINTFADKENIGIWFNNHNKLEKIAAIGVRISKWIAYHGFSINISNDLKKYDSIIPCGIKDKEVTNLVKIVNQNYENISDKLVENLKFNLENYLPALNKVSFSFFVRLS